MISRGQTQKTGAVSLFPLAATALSATAIAGVLAVGDATSHKPHVIVPTGVAYGLIWVLILLYYHASREHWRLPRVYLWSILVALTVVLSFIHLDDASARSVESVGLDGVGSAGVVLYWIVGLDCISAALITLHWLRFGAGSRRSST